MSRTSYTQIRDAQLGWDGAEKKRSDDVPPKPVNHYQVDIIGLTTGTAPRKIHRTLCTLPQGQGS